jgi:hypothetical protein
MVTASIFVLLVLQCAATPAVHAGTGRIDSSNENPLRRQARGGLRSRRASSGLEERGIREIVSTRRRLDDYGDNYSNYGKTGKSKKKEDDALHDDDGVDGGQETWIPSPTEDLTGRLPVAPSTAPHDPDSINLVPTPAPPFLDGGSSPVPIGIQSPPPGGIPVQSNPPGSPPPPSQELTGTPTRFPSLKPTPGSPEEQETDARTAPPSPPTSDGINPTPVPSEQPTRGTKPTPIPQEETTDGSAASNTPSANSPETAGPVTSAPTTSSEEDPSCVAAQSGQVFSTPISTTIYYQYELLTDRTADLTNVVWPAVDESFQKFLAMALVECELGSSSPIQGVSPEPQDSFGTWYADGRGNNCTGIDDFDDEELFCDIVTGSVTIYLSPALYTSNDNGAEAIDETATYLELRNQVFSSLLEEINGKGRLRLRGLEGPSSLVDNDKGIYGLYFLSEPLNLDPETPERAEANSDSTTNSTTVESSQSSSVNVPIVAALAGLTLLVMGIVGFAIHRRNMNMDSDTATLKQVRTELDMSECYSPDSRGSFDESQSRISPREGRIAPTGARHLSASSEAGDVSQPRSDDFGKSYYVQNGELNDMDREESVSFAFSHPGMSIRLTSPDGTVRARNNFDSRTPSTIAFPSHVEEGRGAGDEQRWIADFEHRSEDDSSGMEAGELPTTPTEMFASVSHDAEDNDDDDREWTTTVMKTSAPTSLIMAVANEILGDLDREKDDVQQSRSTAVSSIGPDTTSAVDSRGFFIATTPFSKFKVDSSKSSTAVAVLSETAEDDYRGDVMSPDIQIPTQNQQNLSSSVLTPGTGGSRSFKNESSMRLSSPDSVMNWGFFKTPSPSSSSHKQDPPDSIEESILNSASTSLPPSSSLSDEGSSRTEFLKSRRRELEGRFQEYKEKLSASVSKMDDSSTVGSWLASPEFCRPMDNNDVPSSIQSSGARYGSEQHGKRNASSANPKSATKTPLSSASFRSNRRRRSRTPKPPRIRHNYTSLNDIEDLLDQDQEWKLPDEEGEGDSGNQNLNAFLSSRSYVLVEPRQYQQFQANTVQL